MQLNQETDYALRVVLKLCILGYGNKVEARIVSEEEKIPMRFLLKLLRKLTQVGIVKSFRGVNGGYSINKLPEEIAMLDVVEAIEGPININKCLKDSAFCSKQATPHCAIHNSLASIQRNLINELKGVTFADFTKNYCK